MRQARSGRGRQHQAAAVALQLAAMKQSYSSNVSSGSGILRKKSLSKAAAVCGLVHLASRSGSLPARCTQRHAPVVSALPGRLCPQEPRSLAPLS